METGEPPSSPWLLKGESSKSSAYPVIVELLESLPSLLDDCSIGNTNKVPVVEPQFGVGVESFDNGDNGDSECSKLGVILDECIE